jgi:TRAP-type C4-dicarboxylate transport system permease small subunit
MLRLIDRLIAWFAIPSAVLLLLVVMAGVICRAADHPLSWTDEASGYLMVWCACFGWMSATRKGAHIRIRFFMDRLPSALNRLVRLVFEGALLLLGLVIATKGLHLVQTNLDIEATSMPISAALLYVPLIPAGLVMVMQAVLDAMAIWQEKPALHEGPQS